MDKNKFQINELVVDEVSGFIGVVTTITQYYDKSYAYTVVGKSRGEKAAEEMYLMEERLIDSK